MAEKLLDLQQGSCPWGSRPTKSLDAFERAGKALEAEDAAAARHEVVRALSAMQEPRRAQDVVLDAVVAEPERRAERVTEPRHLDPESEH
jgi:hypothetical protein